VSKPSPTPEARALKYAEETLQVHDVFDAALQARSALSEVAQKVSDLKSKRRSIEAEIHDREMDLTIEEAEKHSMSVSAMERHLKIVFHKDETLRNLRASLDATIAEYSTAEVAVQLCEVDVKIAVARLAELGGYLNYLAAIKQQQTVRAASEAGDTA
jgi:hypothetical protein